MKNHDVLCRNRQVCLDGFNSCQKIITSDEHHNHEVPQRNFCFLYAKVGSLSSPLTWRITSIVWVGSQHEQNHQTQESWESWQSSKTLGGFQNHPKTPQNHGECKPFSNWTSLWKPTISRSRPKSRNDTTLEKLNSKMYPPNKMWFGCIEIFKLPGFIVCFFFGGGGDFFQVQNCAVVNL